MFLNTEYKAIFELNSKSILFTRVAADAINDGEYEKALSILESGIELFEEYPTPFFLMGDLLIKLGRIDDAKIAFEKGNLLLRNPVTLDHYLSLLPNSINISETNIEVKPFENSDDDLVELEDKLKSAKIEISDKDDSKLNNTFANTNAEEFKPLKGLVSETLASIYLNQSNYKEAKAIYETLIDIQPERKEYFQNKLSEIDSKMRSQKSEND